MADFFYMSLFAILAVNGFVLVLAVGKAINSRDDCE
jgi:hypothetical protein